MSHFDDRWERLAALAGTLPAPPIPAPPRQLAARLRRRRAAIIPWPVAVAAAAVLYLAVLPLFPQAWGALTPAAGALAAQLPSLPRLPYLGESPASTKGSP